MKGTSFQNGVEFKVTIEGESWQQGQAVSGALVTVIRGAAPAGTKSRIVLAESTDRKIKNKSADAFSVIGEAEGDAAASWKFMLPRDVRITDKAGGVYLLYGAAEDPHALAQLKLNIVPHHYLQDLIELMRTQYRFALKKVSGGKKGVTDVELTPPASKDWAQLDHLILKLRLADDAIEVGFSFHRAEVDAMKGGLSTKIAVREIERTLPVAGFVHDFNDRLNKDAVETEINAVIEEYRSLGWLA